MNMHMKTAINKRFQELYDAGMIQGKHGHYETMFAAMHEAYSDVLARPEGAGQGEATGREFWLVYDYQGPGSWCVTDHPPTVVRSFEDEIIHVREVVATPRPEASDAPDIVEALRKWADLIPTMDGKHVLVNQAADALAALRAELAVVKRERDNLQARLTARAKSMNTLRLRLALVHDNIEDEGDRAYFGSTNDADTFKEVWQDLDAWEWNDIMEDGKLPDVYEASRKAHVRAEAAEAVNATSAEKERLRFEGDLDRWMKTLGAGITGYQPEAYAVMDAAVAELVAARAANAELRAALEKREQWHKCSCPEPCDDYGVFPGGCAGRYSQDYRDLLRKGGADV